MRPSLLKGHWLWRAMATIAVLVVIGWIIESPIRPGFSRKRDGIFIKTRHAYLHGPPAAIRLNNIPYQSVGHVRFVHSLHANDARWLFAEVHEYRRFQVEIGGTGPRPADMRQWRTTAAKHFGDADVFHADFDGTHTIWFGYPGDILEFLMAVLLIPAAVIALSLGIAHLARSLDSISRIDPRLAALRNRRCPRCRYDIRGLPACRCPECGEAWRDGEVPPGLV